MRLLGFGLAIALTTSCGGHVVPDQPSAPPSTSCRVQREGADGSCGANGKTDCCLAVSVPGGSFNRFNDAAFPASVSAFRVDAFEVTVGRFRAFVDAWPSSRPAVGAGAHPRVPGSGWKSEWDSRLPATREDFSRNLSCTGVPESELTTWQDKPGPYEQAPVACLDWYEAFAFCAWDGGRLLTETEWVYLAVGGNEQRKHPWGPQPIDQSRAVLKHTSRGAFARVGSVPAGVGRWGVFDLAGSRAEYVRDGIRDEQPQLGIPIPCNDCLRDSNTADAYFLLRDAHFNVPAELADVGEDVRAGFNVAAGRTPVIGLRCAR